MTTYDVLKELEEKNLLTDSVKKSVIPYTMVFHKLVYEEYLMRCKTRRSTDAARQTAINQQISLPTVWSIVRKMKT